MELSPQHGRINLGRGIVIAGLGNAVRPGHPLSIREKSYGVSPLQLVFTRPLGLFLALPVAAGMVYLAWRLRRAPASSAQFCLVVVSVLAATLMVTQAWCLTQICNCYPAVFCY